MAGAREQAEAVRAKAARVLAATVNGAVNRLAADMRRPQAAGGRLPVDTGALHRSQVIVADGQVVGFLTGDLPSGDIFVGFTVPYAPFQEYGSRGRPGNYFVTEAAMQWPSFVEKAALAARSAG